MATRLSRIGPTRRSITPPLPSPPITQRFSIMADATWASPTGVRITRHPVRAAMSSIIREVERLAATGPWVSDRTPWAARARVYSSPR